MKWNKRNALNEINMLVAEIEKLKEVRAFSSEHIRWHQRVVSFIEEVFGEDSRLFQSFVNLTWKQTGSFIVGGISDPEGSYNPQSAVEREHNKAYLSQLDTAKGLLLAAKDELERNDIKEVYKGKDTGPEASLILKIINIGEYKLRKTMRIAPGKESEVQESFEDLLIGADIPYSREADSIQYSSKNYKPDFSVSRADLAIEIKICNRKGREKEIIAEINDDILAYKTKYGNIVFFIYDLGFIRDIDRFIKNFEDQEGVVVKVIKH